MPLSFHDFAALLDLAGQRSRYDDFRFSSVQYLPASEEHAARLIWRMKYASLSIRHVRAVTGLSQAAFAARYGIPRRSVENWEAESRRPPDYLPRLLAYAVFSDVLAAGEVLEEGEDDG